MAKENWNNILFNTQQRAINAQENAKRIISKDPTPQNVVNEGSSYKSNPIYRYVATGVDFDRKILRGMGKGLEGALDFSAGAIGLLGDENFKKKIENFVGRDLTSELEKKYKEASSNTGEFGKIYAELEQDSYFNELSEGSKNILNGVLEGVGQMIPSLVIAAGTGGTSLGASLGGKGASAIGACFLGVSAGGSGAEEAINEGANLGKSMAYGTVQGALEFGMEAVTGGLSRGAKAIGLKTTKNIGKDILAEMVSESIEEGGQSLITPITKLIYNKNALGEYSEEGFMKGVAEDALVGGLVGGVMQGASLAGVVEETGGKNAYYALSDMQNNIENYDTLTKEHNKLVRDLKKIESLKDSDPAEYKKRNSEIQNEYEKILEDYYKAKAETTKSIETRLTSLSETERNKLFNDDSNNQRKYISEYLKKNFDIKTGKSKVDYSKNIEQINSFKENYSNNLSYNDDALSQNMKLEKLYDDNGILNVIKNKESIQNKEEIKIAEQVPTYITDTIRNLEKISSDVKVVVVDNLNDNNGLLYNKDVIVLDSSLNSKQLSNITALHEILHKIENTRSGRELYSEVVNEMQRPEYEESKYNNSDYYRELGYEENSIYSEKIVDFLSNELLDENSIERMAENNSSIIKKILTAITRLGKKSDVSKQTLRFEKLLNDALYEHSTEGDVYDFENSNENGSYEDYKKRKSKSGKPLYVSQFEEDPKKNAMYFKENAGVRKEYEKYKKMTIKEIIEDRQKLVDELYKKHNIKKQEKEVEDTRLIIENNEDDIDEENNENETKEENKQVNVNENNKQVKNKNTKSVKRKYVKSTEQNENKNVKTKKDEVELEKQDSLEDLIKMLPEANNIEEIKDKIMDELENYDDEQKEKIVNVLNSFIENKKVIDQIKNNTNTDEEIFDSFYSNLDSELELLDKISNKYEEDGKPMDRAKKAFAVIEKYADIHSEYEDVYEDINEKIETSYKNKDFDTLKDLSLKLKDLYENKLLKYSEETQEWLERIDVQSEWENPRDEWVEKVEEMYSEAEDYVSNFEEISSNFEELIEDTNKKISELSKKQDDGKKSNKATETVATNPIAKNEIDEKQVKENKGIKQKEKYVFDGKLLPILEGLYGKNNSEIVAILKERIPKIKDVGEKEVIKLYNSEMTKWFVANSKDYSSLKKEIYKESSYLPIYESQKTDNKIKIKNIKDEILRRDGLTSSYEEKQKNGQKIDIKIVANNSRLLVECKSKLEALEAEQKTIEESIAKTKESIDSKKAKIREVVQYYFKKDKINEGIDEQVKIEDVKKENVENSNAKKEIVNNNTSFDKNKKQQNNRVRTIKEDVVSKIIDKDKTSKKHEKEIEKSKENIKEDPTQKTTEEKESIILSERFAKVEERLRELQKNGNINDNNNTNEIQLLKIEYDNIAKSFDKLINSALNNNMTKALSIPSVLIDEHIIKQNKFSILYRAESKSCYKVSTYKEVGEMLDEIVESQFGKKMDKDVERNNAVKQLFRILNENATKDISVKTIKNLIKVDGVADMVLTYEIVRRYKEAIGDSPIDYEQLNSLVYSLKNGQKAPLGLDEDSSFTFNYAVEKRELVNRVLTYNGDALKIKDTLKMKNLDLVLQMRKQATAYKDRNKIWRTLRILREQLAGGKLNTVLANSPFFKSQMKKLSSPAWASGDITKPKMIECISYMKELISNKNPVFQDYFNKEGHIKAEFRDGGDSFGSDIVATKLDTIKNVETELFAKLNSLERNSVISPEILHNFKIYVQSIKKLFESYQDVWLDGKKYTMVELITSQLENTEKVKRVFSKSSKPTESIKRLVKYIESPNVYIKEICGWDTNAPIYKVFEELQRGEVLSTIELNNSTQGLTEMLKDRNGYRKRFLKEGIDFIDSNTGKTVKLPVSVAINLYLMATTGTSTIDGLALNGFTFKDFDGSKNKELYGKGVNIEDVEKLSYNFTAEDKKYIELTRKMYEYLSKLKEGADVSISGITNNIDDYYPNVRETNSISTNPANSAGANVFRTIYNMSINTDRKANKNGLYIENAYELAMRQANLTVKYSCLGESIDKMGRMLGGAIKVDEAGHKKSVKGQIEDIDPRFKTYMTNLLSDLIGARNSTINWLKPLRSVYSTSHLGLNPNVSVAQLASIPAMYGYFGIGSMLEACTINPKKGIDEAKEHSLYFKARVMNSDIIRSESNTETISKFADKTTFMIKAFDSLAFGYMWNASKIEARKKYPGLDLKNPYHENKNGDWVRLNNKANVTYERYNASNVSHAELVRFDNDWDKVNKIFEKVGRETQPNYSNTQRSAMMRSPNELTKSLTMFKSVSMRYFSMLTDSLGELLYLRKLKNANIATKEELSRYSTSSKKAFKAFTAVLSANAMYVLIKEAFKWLYNKDDEEEFYESFLKNFGASFAGMIPIINEAYQYLVQGYDAENFTYSMINDVLDSVGGFVNIVEKDVNGENITTQETAKCFKNLTYAISNFLGIPTRNAYNFITGITRRISPSTGYKVDSFFATNITYRSYLTDALEANDEAKASAIIDVLMSNSGNKESKINSTISDLYAKGYSSVLPRTISDKISYDGVEYKLSKKELDRFKEINSKSTESVNKLTRYSSFKNSSDDVKSKSIKMIYDYYYTLAISDYIGDGEISKLEYTAKIIPIEQLAIIVKTCQDYKTDETSSKKEKAVKLIESQSLTASQKYLILAYLGYAKKENKEKIEQSISASGLTQTEKNDFMKKLGF